MSISKAILTNEERAVFALRELYSSYGYLRYKVSKFEEYDLYARNKNFLISENILTFTDTDGRLMALKPDVTLSIIKNLGNSAAETHKLYYNENVYRTSASADGFREIMQIGLECIGKIDTYAMCEVITLAQKSLDLISEENILDVSHMGLITGMLESLDIGEEEEKTLLALIENKNTPAIRALCEKLGVEADKTASICKMTTIYAPLGDALSEIKEILYTEKMQAAYSELCEVCEYLARVGNAGKVYLDFSTVNDMNYYNGITFKGFVNGIPDGVLSGGRYDRLMQKMGKSAGAVGFAVYLDMLSRFSRDAAEYDVDILLTYDGSADTLAVLKAADELRADGKSVRVELGEPVGIRYKEKIDMTKGGGEQ